MSAVRGAQTYRLKQRSVRPVATTRSRWRDYRLGVAAVAGIVLLLLGGNYLRALYAPRGVAEVFLQAHQRQDYDALYELFDDEYRSKVSREQSRALLEQIHRYMPTDLKVQGFIRQLDNECAVIVSFAALPSGRTPVSGKNQFGIDVVRDERGQWRIPFMAAYGSFFKIAYGEPGVKFLRAQYRAAVAQRSRG